MPSAKCRETATTQDSALSTQDSALSTQHSGLGTQHSGLGTRHSSMNIIRRLPPELVARIAAGEVVERPASVLKELVENALDAHASRIVAEIESGGMARVRISDDGAGMSPTDLSLAVQPHATSKLSDADQLHALDTLGFRGEALPSIASVSRFSIVSRQRPAPPQPALEGSADDAGQSAADDAIAWKIEVDGGRPESPEPHPASGPYGTTVDARELFYNLPARQKFLKGLAAEASACADTFLRLALTRPDVAFTLRQGRSELLALSACKPVLSDPSALGGANAARRSAQAAPELPPAAYFRRAREALGGTGCDGLIEIDFRDRGDALRSDLSGPAHAPGPDGGPIDPPYRLFGLLSPPAVTRPNRGAIYLTVNGRAVKDRTLTSALLEAFRHLLPPRRFPIAVLYLEIPGDDVDINVHPAKSEVRFRLPSRIYALFYHAVRSACGLDARSSADSPRDAANEPVAHAVFAPGAHGANRAAETRFGQSTSSEFAPRPAFNGARTETGSAPRQPRPDARWNGPRADLTFPASGPLFRTSADAGLWPHSRTTLNETLAADASPAQTVNEDASAPYGEPDPAPAENRPAASADFRVIGQAAGSYIIVEDESGVRLIDQHALHERILFERLLHAAHTRSRGDAQGLLVPETVDLSAAQAALVSSGSDTLELLAHLGFDCEPFGARSLVLRSVPAILRNTAPARLLLDLLEALALGDDAAQGGAKALRRWTLREKAAYILSCKAAIKAGERLTLDQMTALILEFQAVAGPIRAGVLTCPHGRPLALEISWYELERAVGRK